jgi:hypothetical protein
VGGEVAEVVREAEDRNEQLVVQGDERGLQKVVGQGTNEAVDSKPFFYWGVKLY